MADTSYQKKFNCRQAPKLYARTDSQSTISNSWGVPEYGYDCSRFRMSLRGSSYRFIPAFSNAEDL